MGKPATAPRSKRKRQRDEVRLTGDRLVVEHPDSGEHKSRAAC